MPTLLLTIYWRRFNQTGALFAIIAGLVMVLDRSHPDHRVSVPGTKGKAKGKVAAKA